MKIRPEEDPLFGQTILSPFERDPRSPIKSAFTPVNGVAEKKELDDREKNQFSGNRTIEEKINFEDDSSVQE